jgi:hypothetical protein
LGRLDWTGSGSCPMVGFCYNVQKLRGQNHSHHCHLMGTSMCSSVDLQWFVLSVCWGVKEWILIFQCLFYDFQSCPPSSPSQTIRKGEYPPFNRVMKQATESGAKMAQIQKKWKRFTVQIECLGYKTRMGNCIQSLSTRSPDAFHTIRHTSLALRFIYCVSKHTAAELITLESLQCIVIKFSFVLR